jgi:hypothetical protein
MSGELPSAISGLLRSFPRRRIPPLLRKLCSFTPIVAAAGEMVVKSPMKAD